MCVGISKASPRVSLAEVDGTEKEQLDGISRELIKNKAPFAILDKSDLRFRELHLTLDSVSSELHRTSVGVKLITSWYKLVQADSMSNSTLAYVTLLV